MTLTSFQSPPVFIRHFQSVSCWLQITKLESQSHLQRVGWLLSDLRELQLTEQVEATLRLPYSW